MLKLRAAFVQWVLRMSAQAMVWAYVQIGRSKGWTPPQLTAARRIAMQEQNAIWDSVRGVILWNKSEDEIVTQRLARRFDPGMTLNEVANRAIDAKKALREGAGPPLTGKQLAALEHQKAYLERVVRDS